MSHIINRLLLLFRFRHRLAEFVLTDVRQRYGGSILGVAWVVVFPILQLSIYACLYALIFRVRPPNLSTEGYVVLVFSGMVPLLAFSEALSASASTMVSNRALLLNTVFPAELIPLRAVLAAQLSGIAALVLTLGAGFIFGDADWKAFVFVPFLWLALVMFVGGLGWYLSLLSLVVRDIQHVLGLIVMLMFVLSPFAYTPEMVPSALKFILYLNPMSYFVFSFQSLICYGEFPEVWHLIVILALALVSFMSGFIFFQRTKRVFFDYA
ncbi:ABC transporter permease [Pyruvatibacter mobilis]|uniref:ABC transporter permease n=1 Tax=Pyruvatibacter mobilis TaxID=1712261 RepID=UPI003BAAA360